MDIIDRKAGVERCLFGKETIKVISSLLPNCAYT
jgi:hypothetical protein